MSANLSTQLKLFLSREAKKKKWSSGEFPSDHGMTTGFSSQPMVQYRIFKVYTKIFKNIQTTQTKISWGILGVYWRYSEVILRLY